jgi:hypothetical protein
MPLEVYSRQPVVVWYDDTVSTRCRNSKLAREFSIRARALRAENRESKIENRRGQKNRALSLTVERSSRSQRPDLRLPFLMSGSNDTTFRRVVTRSD